MVYCLFLPKDLLQNRGVDHLLSILPKKASSHCLCDLRIVIDDHFVRRAQVLINSFGIAALLVYSKMVAIVLVVRGVKSIKATSS